MENLKNVEKVIKELIFDISDENILGDISHYDNRDLLKLDSLLYFACTDAVIRLRGVSEEVTDWKRAFDKAARFSKELTPEILAKLYLQTRDETAVIELIYHRVNRYKTQCEILQRIEKLQYSKTFFDYVRYDGELGSLDKLLEDTGKAVRGVHKHFGVSTHQDIERAENAVLAISETYEKLKRAFTTLDVNELEPIALSRSVNRQGWEEAKVPNLQAFLKRTLEEILPILEGKAERIPEDVYNIDRQRYRKAQRDFLPRKGRIKHDVDSLELDYGDGEASQLKVSHDKIVNLFNLLKPENINERLDIEKACRKITDKARDPKATEAALTMILRGYPTTEISAETGLSQRTIRNYRDPLRKIVLSYLKESYNIKGC